MSELIGPIHKWLYNKIIMQESINIQVFYLAEKMGWTDSLEKQTNERIGSVSFGPLEDIVDKEDVHGWLQKRLELEERRFAFAVMSLIKEDVERLELIENRMYEFGTNVVLKNAKNAVEVAAEIDGLLLNGMPCDGVTSVVKKDENCVETEIKKLIHEPFWKEQGGTNDIYERLVDSFIRGIINKSVYSYSREGRIRKIYRE